jgi:hypothetical protein
LSKAFGLKRRVSRIRFGRSGEEEEEEKEEEGNGED